MSVGQAVYELKNLSLVEFSYRGKLRWKLSRATKKQLLLMNVMMLDKIITRCYIVHIIAKIQV